MRSKPRAVWVVWLGVALLAGVLLVLGTRPRAQQAVTLPALTFENLSGTPVSLASLKGKPLVVNVWATWCVPCRREMPMLVKLSQANPGITFAFVNAGEGPAAVEVFQKEINLKLPLVLLDKEVQLTDALGVQGLPTTLFFDAQGKLVNRHIGEVTLAEMEELLKDL